MKDIFAKFMYSFVFLLILLYIWQPSVLLILLLLDGIWLLALMKYSRDENKYFWDSLLVITLACCMAFFGAKYCRGSECRDMLFGESILAMIGCFEVFVSRGCMAYHSHCFTRKKRNTVYAPELMKAQQYDMVRLKNFIWKHQIVGLNGAWGAGKSFLIQKLYEDSDFQKEFEVIPIDLLAVHLEEIEKILMRNLDDIMEKYGIFSGVSSKLQSLLGNYQFVDHLKFIFFQSTEIVSSAFQKYKEDVEKLPNGKKILIVFDDIDRMTDKQKIMRIFALSEKFSSERIHIVYQFGYEYLEEREFNHQELEKFIPYVVTLTDIPYEDMVSHLWEECQMERTGLKQDEVRLFLHKDIYNYEINKMLHKREIHLSLTIDHLPIRGVKIFLKELETMISENSFYQIEENQKILLSVLFLKNFLFNYFDLLSVGKDVMDSLLFHLGSEKKTIRELIQNFNKEKDEDAFVKIIQTNKEIYHILNLLEFDFFIADKTGGREEKANIDPKILKRLQKNEKINHIVWNVIGNGFSEYSDMEQAVRELFENVLTEGQSQWKENWNDFGQKSYVLDLYKNNRGITWFGMDQYLSFFQAMRVNPSVTENQWRRWIAFYFTQEKEKGITVEMIENLKYCDFTKGKDFYLDTIRFFSECTIRGNFNGEPCFLRFLHVFIPPVLYLGYSHGYQFEEWMYSDTEWKQGTLELLKEQLETGMETLDREKERALIQVLADEIESIKKFMQKCLEIMSAEKTMKANELQLKFSGPRTVYKHQEELDRLETILESFKPEDEQGKEMFLSQLEDSYQIRKIEPSEYQVLYRLYREKMKLDI